jgi:hypothetical protein
MEAVIEIRGGLDQIDTVYAPDGLAPPQIGQCHSRQR